ncbi:MAG: dipicolinate synthase subunit DpsA [Oscillospiraceae bacterium]|jgi:dipicolinate synthase subunit A
MKFAVLGGDHRFEILCKLLHTDGHTVRAFALDTAQLPAAICTTSVEEAVEQAGCVILPLPLSRNGVDLNAPLSERTHPLTKLFPRLPQKALLCAGRVEPWAKDLAAQSGVQLQDYLQREEFAIYNAVATAEGAVELIIKHTPITLWNSRILVIGFGRIGKVLSHRLRGMGAEVTVSARNCADRAWGAAYGYRVLDTSRLEGQLSDFHVVINTVPARVLGEGRLAELHKDTLCMDLASRPGGMDFDAASRLGVRALWALSLPGEVAPQSAGAAIRDTVYNMIEEQERENQWKS